MRSDAIPMVGKRYGALRVIADLPHRRYPSGFKVRMVLVRCDCGRVYEACAPDVRYRLRKHGCVDCRPENGVSAVRSVRLPDGRSIAQIAKASGLRLDTVYHRYIRGWPHHRLGEVIDAPYVGRRTKASREAA